MVLIPANAQTSLDGVMEQPEECWCNMKSPPHVNGMTHEERIKSIEDAVEVILWAIGEDATREGLKDTPKRVAKMWVNELGAGYQGTLDEVFGSAIFNEGFGDMIMVRDIPFYSSCEHHLVPYYGVCHVAYIPRNGKIVGISKIARLIEKAGRRLTIQERLGHEVAETFERMLNPEGVMVVIDAEHLCMCARGVQKPGSRTTTSVLRGIFKFNEAARNEFLALIRQ